MRHLFQPHVRAVEMSLKCGPLGAQLVVSAGLRLRYGVFVTPLIFLKSGLINARGQADE